MSAPALHPGSQSARQRQRVAQGSTCGRFARDPRPFFSAACLSYVPPRASARSSRMRALQNLTGEADRPAADKPRPPSIYPPQASPRRDRRRVAARPVGRSGRSVPGRGEKAARRTWWLQLTTALETRKTGQTGQGPAECGGWPSEMSPANETSPEPPASRLRFGPAAFTNQPMPWRTRRHFMDRNRCS